MTDAVVAWPPRRVPPSTASSAPRVRTLHGERLVVGATAAAVAAIPLLAPAGPANVAPVDLLIGLAVAACLFWAGSSRQRLRFPYALPMGLLIVGGGLGALVGPLPRSGLIAMTQDAVLLLWCWTIVNVASSVGRLRVVLEAWVYAAIAWAVLLFAGLALGVPFLTGQTPSEGSRTSLTFLDPNYAANYWFISIMVLWATGLPRRRGARMAAYVLLVAALVSTGSNGGILSLVVGIGVAAVLAAHGRFGTPAAALTVAVLVLVGYLAVANVSVPAIQQAAYGSSIAFIRDGIGHGHKAVTERSTLRDQSVTLWREGGLLGAGPVSTKTRLRREMAPYVKEAHNDYAAALIERGVIGFLGLALLIAGFVLRAPSLARARLAPAYAAVVARPHALIGAVAGTMAAMAVVELLHARHVWTLFAFVAAVAIWGRR